MLVSGHFCCLDLYSTDTFERRRAGADPGGSGCGPSPEAPAREGAHWAHHGRPPGLPQRAHQRSKDRACSAQSLPRWLVSRSAAWARAHSRLLGTENPSCACPARATPAASTRAFPPCPLPAHRSSRLWPCTPAPCDLLSPSQCHKGRSHFLKSHFHRSLRATPGDLAALNRGLSVRGGRWVRAHLAQWETCCATALQVAGLLDRPRVTSSDPTSRRLASVLRSPLN